MIEQFVFDVVELGIDGDGDTEDGSGIHERLGEVPEHIVGDITCLGREVTDVNQYDGEEEHGDG
jgi:hypothetical protein